VQSETLTALEQARDARDAADAASGSQDRWQELADSAKDESEKQEYQQKADQAGDDADQAAGVISSARGTIESAVSDRDRSAEHAIDQIEEITSSDDLNDGWWENWGSKLVAAIADIADMISTIAGILAIVVAFIPIIGTALAGVLIVIAAGAPLRSPRGHLPQAPPRARCLGGAGVATGLLDEVRQAVGEACTRAVLRHKDSDIDDLVRVEFSIGDRFVAKITDNARDLRAKSESRLAASRYQSDARANDHDAIEEDTLSEEITLIVLGGLVEDLVVTGPDGERGTTVTMSWPLPGRASASDH
jgi:hypothetical protein